MTWTTGSYEERAAALAAVKRKGVSQKVRACYLAPSAVKPQGAAHTKYVQPTTLQGGKTLVTAALAAESWGAPVPSSVPPYVTSFMELARQVPGNVLLPSAPVKSVASSSGQAPAAPAAVASSSEQAPAAPAAPVGGGSAALAASGDQGGAAPAASSGQAPPPGLDGATAPAPAASPSLIPEFVITGERKAIWCGLEVEQDSKGWVWTKWDDDWYVLRGPDPRFNLWNPLHLWEKRAHFSLSV